ncbi:MAG: hypothetical protein H7Y01_07135 [Ferruginibacter sp.]|nr:hypothetical protein [Chitinophagaceae bacterium]
MDYYHQEGITIKKTRLKRGLLPYTGAIKDLVVGERGRGQDKKKQSLTGLCLVFNECVSQLLI